MSFFFQPWPVITVALASCIRLNTEESFQKATHIFNHFCDEKQRNLSRITHLYVFLASEQGHVEEAYEILGMTEM